MMPKSEHAARLAMRKSHRADAPVCKHKGEPGKSWVAGDRADTVRYFGDKKYSLTRWRRSYIAVRENFLVKVRINQHRDDVMKTSCQTLARAIRAQKANPPKTGRYSVKSGRSMDWAVSDQRRHKGRHEFVQISA